MSITISDLTQAFLDCDLDASGFHHREHLQVAFDLLATRDFIDASTLYAKNIHRIATLAGADDKFNITVTFAFLSLIAERMAQAPNGDFETFLDQNRDLMAPDILTRWYTPERLKSPLARRVFLLP